MKAIVSLFLVISSMIASAQPPLRFVRDQQNGAPVPFAAIKVKDKPGGIITNAGGDFRLSVMGDSIIVSAAGYHDKVLYGLFRDSVILLQPKASAIQGLDHRLLKPAGSVLIGMPEEDPKDVSWGPGAKAEIAQRFTLPEKKVYKLKKVLLPMSSSGCPGKVLMHVYAFDSATGLPGEELLVREIDIVRVKIRRKIAHIDADGYDIFFNRADHFFISFSWLHSAFNENCLTTIRMNRNGRNHHSYSRALVNNHYGWGKFCVQASNGNCEGGSMYGAEIEAWE